MDENIQCFLKSEAFSSSVAAAFRHTKIYRGNVSDTIKAEFHDELRKILDEISSQYANTRISDELHITNIEYLQRTIIDKNTHILVDSGFTIGIAQKILNLYLKYLWCYGLIQEPPQCPFDQIILEIIKWKGAPWTKINTLEEYKRLKEQAKEKAKEKALSDHLAVWELKLWNERNIKNI